MALAAEAPSAHRSFARQALHVAALSALAVAQPVFDVVRRDSEFLVAHRVGRPDLLLFVLALVVRVVHVGRGLPRCLDEERHRRPPPPPLDRRSRTAFGLLIAAQAAHSIEEYAFRLFVPGVGTAPALVALSSYLGAGLTRRGRQSDRSG